MNSEPSDWPDFRMDLRLGPLHHSARSFWNSVSGLDFENWFNGNHTPPVLSFFRNRDRFSSLGLLGADLNETIEWWEQDLNNSIAWLYRKAQPEDNIIYIHHHHHQLNVHFLPRSTKGMDGCFPTALGRQSTILKAAVYPWDTLHYITSHYITLHHITSHYITLHRITSHYITLHHITSHYITLHHITSHYITLHHITSHYITLHHITSHYITLYHIASHRIASHRIVSHHITSHYITLNHIT